MSGLRPKERSQLHEHRKYGLLSESRFRSITGKDIVDSSRIAEAILQLRVESRERVDELVDNALAADGAQLTLSVLHTGLEMLVMCGGQERTQVQYADLLAAAGFGPTRVIATGEQPPHHLRGRAAPPC